MNELRMYVEHLFEGKVLTPENIELKEEIYGNLVARYEDLLSEGVPEADALRRTKESITSVDDVLAVRDAEAMAGNAGNGAEGPGTSASEAESVKASGEAFVPREPGAEDGSTCASGSSECGHHQDVAEVVRPLDADERVAGSVQDAADTGKGAHADQTSGAPVPPISNGDGAQDVGGAARTRKLWPWGCVGAVAFVIALGIIGALMFGVTGLVDTWDDLDDSIEDVDVAPAPDSTDASKGESQSANVDESRSRVNDEIRVDEQGQVWIDGELGDELARDVINAGYGDVAPYANTDLSDAKAVEALVGVLPMGEYASGIDVTKGVDVLSLAYRELPEALDGDSVDAALAYDVTALFCAMPLVNEIQITVTERDDPLDESYYVFSRDTVQNCYGVRLDDALINETGWTQLKEDSLYRRKFIDHMLDAAEREWD